jgi:hypothetical protein
MTIGIVVCFGIALLAWYGGLRAVCWWTGDEDYMFFIWLGIFYVPLLTCAFFAGLGVLAMAYADRDRPLPPEGFAVLSNTKQPNP